VDPVCQLAWNGHPAKVEEGSNTFLYVTITKALDQRKQAEMIALEAKGMLLTEHGCWNLLGKGKMQLEKAFDDSEAAEDGPKAATEVRDDSGAKEMKAAAFPMSFALLPPPTAAAGSLLEKNDAKPSALRVQLGAPQLLMEAR
jgi:hypothetical protein